VELGSAAESVKDVPDVFATNVAPEVLLVVFR
jgi:hypothetical protein